MRYQSRMVVRGALAKNAATPFNINGGLEMTDFFLSLLIAALGVAAVISLIPLN